MKKQILGICFISILSICFNVIQYSLNNNLKSTILTYEKQLNSSGNYLANENGNVQQNTTLDDVSIINTDNIQWHLKEVPHLYFHNFIDGAYEEWFSATGPIANINPYCINVNPNSIKIIESGDAYFTKISIEGYVPTWYLTQNDENINFKSISEEKYILDKTNAYYGANENSGAIKLLSKGTAIEVIGESNGWYYIKLLSEASVNYPEMWVKKDFIGVLSTSGTVINMEVRVKKGTVGILENNEVQSSYILDSTRIGKIQNENDTNYYVTFPGAFGLYIEKEDVEFIGQ
ncbi:hypothetical protein [Anaerotignum sp.]|uniref:hypothetical protein n=1 Tax=Anaerotignum sp. TaxID=2039241 RepID=UPI00289B6782|nr:hypothetical protein [Anaerotignum sp.]